MTTRNPTYDDVAKAIRRGHLKRDEDHSCFKYLYAATLQNNPYTTVDPRELGAAAPRECAVVLRKWIRVVAEHARD